MTTQSDDAGRAREDQPQDQREDLDQGQDQEHDQDSEPTMSAPEEGRPDGLEALKDGSGEGDGSE